MYILLKFYRYSTSDVKQKISLPDNDLSPNEVRSLINLPNKFIDQLTNIYTNPHSAFLRGLDKELFQEKNLFDIEEIHQILQLLDLSNYKIHFDNDINYFHEFLNNIFRSHGGAIAWRNKMQADYLKTCIGKINGTPCEDGHLVKDWNSELAGEFYCCVTDY